MTTCASPERAGSTRAATVRPRGRTMFKWPLQPAEGLQDLVGFGRVELQDRVVAGPSRVGGAVSLADLEPGRRAVAAFVGQRDLQGRRGQAVGLEWARLVDELRGLHPAQREQRVLDGVGVEVLGVRGRALPLVDVDPVLVLARGAL